MTDVQDPSVFYFSFSFIFTTPDSKFFFFLVRHCRGLGIMLENSI